MYVKIRVSNGDIIETPFNGTPSDAIGYYMGRTLNTGSVEDRLGYGCEVTLDGITYNPSTHRYLSAAEHAKNLALVESRIAARDALDGPRIGDFLKVGSEYLRFTHDWGDTIQTTCARYGDATHHGGFHACKSGGTSYSGSLDSSIEKENLRLSDETRNAAFWMFSNDYASAHNGVTFYMPCRVYTINPFDMPRLHKAELHHSDGHIERKELHGTTASIIRENIGRRRHTGGQWRIVEKMRFYDGEVWMTHKTQARVLWLAATGYAVDHGEPLGLELFCEKQYGSKWFTDARREQILEHADERGFFNKLITKEF